MSIFNDKALKGVAEAAAKIMGEQLKGNQHKIDANKNGKVDAHDFKLLRGKKDMKKEEVEQLDEISADTASNYLNKVKAKHGTNYNDLPKKRQRGVVTAMDIKMNAAEKKMKKEDVELDEAFPTVADAKKRMDAGKTSTGSVTKTSKGLVHKRDYKDEDESDDAQKKSTSYGARQNYKRSTRVNEELSFTEMLELYNEHGLKVLAPIETEEMDIDGTTIEVIDGDKINGYVETTVEEVTNDEFTKEFKDQQASFEGKKKQPKVVAGKTMGVKTMPEEYENLDEKEGYGSSDPLENRANYAKRHGTGQVYKKTYPGDKVGMSKSYAYDIKRTGPKKKLPEEYEEIDEKLEIFHSTSPGAQMKRYHKDSPAPEAKAHRDATAAAAKGLRASGALKRKSFSYGSTDDIKTPKGGTVHAIKREEVELDERSLTSDEKSEMEKNVKGMKKKLSGFKDRYGDDAKSVMYATATKMAKKD